LVKRVLKCFAVDQEFQMLDGGSLKMWMGISDSVHDTGKLLFASLDPQNCTRAGNFVPDLILHQSRSIFDKPGRFLRMRHVGHMAGIHLDRLGMGALRHHPLPGPD